MNMLTITAVCCITLSSVGQQRDQREDELIDTIVQANRANKRSLESLDLNYMVEVISPGAESKSSRIVKKGRYAFSGDRDFSSETIEGKGEGIVYVRDGSKLRMRTISPNGSNLVAIGSVGIANIYPGSPDPWSSFDGGISTRLDSLEQKGEGKVLSAEEVFENGESQIKVIIQKPMPTPDGKQFMIPVTVWYSVKNGYLPVACSWGLDDKWTGRGRIEGRSEVRKFGRYEVNGNEVFIPLDARDILTRGDATESIIYMVDTKSVRINPSLPSDFFEIPIGPQDQVMNLDLGVEVQGPGGRAFLMEVPDAKTIGIAPESSVGLVDKNVSAASGKLDRSGSIESQPVATLDRASMKTVSAPGKPWARYVLLGILGLGIVIAVIIQRRRRTSVS